MAAALVAEAISYAELRSSGLSRRTIRRMLAEGRLLRLRRGRYAQAGADEDFHRAARLGGRLDCLSLLVAAGVFVRECLQLHVQLTVGASRVPLAAEDVVRHWRATVAQEGALGADLVEALAQSCRCQGADAAVATIDSAWHKGLIDEVDIAAIFALLPARYPGLRTQLDPRAEAGTESLVRLMLWGLGCSVELQVQIDRVGRVDLVVDGWLIVECDSRAHHRKSEDQLRDRRRDLAAAEQGFVTLRLLAEDILFRPETVLVALRQVIAGR